MFWTLTRQRVLTIRVDIDALSHVGAMMNHPCPRVFSSVLSGTISELWNYPRSSLSPFLPLICTAVFRSVGNDSRGSVIPAWERFNKALSSLLLDIESVNQVEKYLQLDFRELRSDAWKEQQLVKKLPGGENPASRVDSVLSSIKDGLVTEFEKSGEEKRFRLVLSELLHLIQQVGGLWCLCPEWRGRGMGWAMKMLVQPIVVAVWL